MRIVATLVAWLFAFGAIAQGYPNRPVKVVVPWPPGQATDTEQARYGDVIRDANIRAE